MKKIKNFSGIICITNHLNNLYEIREGINKKGEMIMSKFTQNEETEIVKSARDFSATIEYEEREVKRLKSESFSEPPEPAVQKILEKAKKVEPKYPEKPQNCFKIF
ncbi:MAG: hypothetical protein V8S32_02375 [Lachnospiraceae bacterium]